MYIKYNRTRNALKFAGQVVALLLFVDFVGFIAWTMSVQFPVDNFYIGTITTHVLRFIISIL